MVNRAEGQIPITPSGRSGHADQLGALAEHCGTVRVKSKGAKEIVDAVARVRLANCRNLAARLIERTCQRQTIAGNRPNMHVRVGPGCGPPLLTSIFLVI